MKYKKYSVVDSWPIIMYGSSTGRIPIHVRIIQSTIKHQNMI